MKNFITKKLYALIMGIVFVSFISNNLMSMELPQLKTAKKMVFERDPYDLESLLDCSVRAGLNHLMTLSIEKINTALQALPIELADYLKFISQKPTLSGHTPLHRIDNPLFIDPLLFLGSNAEARTKAGETILLALVKANKGVVVDSWIKVLYDKIDRYKKAWDLVQNIENKEEAKNVLYDHGYNELGDFVQTSGCAQLKKKIKATASQFKRADIYGKTPIEYAIALQNKSLISLLNDAVKLNATITSSTVKNKSVREKLFAPFSRLKKILTNLKKVKVERKDFSQEEEFILELMDFRDLKQIESKYSAQGSEFQKRIMEFLSNPSSPMDVTALHEAKNPFEVDFFMLLNGSLCHNKTIEGKTPLLYMICEDRTYAALQLLNYLKPEDCNVWDDYGMTPLAYAALDGNCKLVTALLEKGADCFLQGLKKNNKNQKRKPLFLAIEQKNNALFDLIVADITSKNNPDWPLKTSQLIVLLSVALENDNDYALAQLLPKDVTLDAFVHGSTNLLMYSANRQQVKSVKKLLAFNKNLVSIVNAQQCNVLMYALNNPKQPVKKTILTNLIKAGADVNARDANGASVLKYAIDACVDISIVKLLLDSDADLNIANPNGLSLIHYIIDNATVLDKRKKDYVYTVLDVILSHPKVTVNAVDTSRRTPLMIATKKGNLEIAYLLKDKGADLSLKDNAGHTFRSYINSSHQYSVAFSAL